jgi:uncharacterized membrane protein
MKHIYNKAIVTDPAKNFRFLARQGMSGRASLVVWTGFIYLIAMELPIQILFGDGGILAAGGNETSWIISTSPYSPAMFSTDYLDSVAASLAPLYGSTALYSILIGGAMALGLAIFGLQLRRFQPTNIGQVFSGFNNFGRALGLYLLEGIFIFLWALLLIIPGIVAMYRYRLAVYILADNPEISPLEAINISKEMMKGNKGSLFYLDLTFIGWSILSSLAASIPMVIIGGFLGAAGLANTTGLAVTYVQPVGVLVAIATTSISALAMGWLAIYQSTAVAAFYERATGLIVPQYVGYNNYPPQQNIG